MRLWHERLIPRLCQKHLCAMWREGLGAYKIVTTKKGGSYKQHPAVIEFENAPWRLLQRLHKVRDEMLRRGYHPKPLPRLKPAYLENSVKPWQTLDEQRAVLRRKRKDIKSCMCRV